MTERSVISSIFPPIGRSIDWPRLTCAALTRLGRCLRRVHVLSWWSCGRIATGLLPHESREEFVHRLALLNRSLNGRNVAWDALDCAAARVLFPGGSLEFARAALFGPPGQGAIHEARHREQLFNQLSAEILRSCRDDNSLRYASDRAMNHPDVLKDPLLASMLRSFIAERQAELNARIYSQRLASNLTTPPWQSVSRADSRGTPDRQQIRAAYERIHREFEGRLIHYDVSSAEKVLERLAGMQDRYPDMISLAEISRCRVDLARVRERRAGLESEISEVADRAVAAARDGRNDEVAGLLRRLTMFQSAGPHVFSDARRKQIEDAIAQASDAFEHREAAARLLELERAAAAEVRRMAGHVRAFHEAVRHLPQDSPQFRDAEQAYRATTLEEVRAHDADWLADLMIELDERLEEFHDVTGRAEAQVAEFLHRVRNALNHVRNEVRQIRRESSAAGKGTALPDPRSPS